MSILIATDSKIYVEDKKIYTTEKLAKILPRYYESFGKLVLLIRVLNDKPSAELTDITSMVEEVIGFTTFYELYSKKVAQKLKTQITQIDLVIGRFESFSAILAYNYAHKYNKKFMGEVMSDPWDGLWNHSLLGKIIAPYAYFKTKQAMRNADFGLYVTDSFLQKRYPCPNKTVAASNVYIKDFDRSVLDARIERMKQMDYSELTLMTTAATYVKYKGQEYVIKAIPYLNDMGFKVNYLIVGEGDQTYLRKIAVRKGVIDQCFFLGRKTHDEVLTLLDRCDIYIQPSLQEGLPRAVIEAMSRGCPCLGTPTAGIPELLDEDCLFKKKSPLSIRDSIVYLVSNNLMSKKAYNNYERSLNYSDKYISERRNLYFRYVLEQISF